jgi:TusA-related sulfurtransferase
MPAADAAGAQGAECTDPLTEIDIPNLINQTGDELMETARGDKVITFRIRKR